MSFKGVEASESPDGEQALSVTALSKTFAGVRVLTDVSLSIAPGEVHALLGQNGSGKSTLIKCLAGVHRPDPGGSVRVAGRQLPHTYAPSDSSSFGLAFVHQDLGLIPDMTVAENLALGTGFQRRGPLIRRGAQRSRAAALLDNFGLAVSPETRVRDLPVTARTLLAIVRAFQPQQAGGSAELACLVLDEPTAALPDNDAGLLFEAIGQVTRAGVGVVYVTHRLEEVFRIADRATVLRDGHLVASLNVADTTRDELVRTIVGQREARLRRQEHSAPRPDRVRQPVAFRAVGLTGQRIRNVSLEVGAGEIVGVAGLAGTGRSELARLIFGAQTGGGGSRYVGQSLVDAATPKKAIAAGIALVPEDRRGDGCVLTMSVSQNLTLLTLDRKLRGLLDLRAEKKRVADTIRRFDIRPADPNQHVMTLSGGNQQKVVLAKWLARSPKLLVLDEPVQGVDVGAKAEIFLQLREAAAAGMAILVIDSDFDNLVELCDRVLVLRGGEIAEDVHGDRLTASHLAQVTFGIPDQDLNLPAAPRALAAP